MLFPIKTPEVTGHWKIEGKEIQQIVNKKKLGA